MLLGNLKVLLSRRNPHEQVVNPIRATVLLRGLFGDLGEQDPRLGLDLVGADRLGDGLPGSCVGGECQVASDRRIDPRSFDHQICGKRTELFLAGPQAGLLQRRKRLRRLDGTGLGSTRSTVKPGE